MAKNKKPEENLDPEIYTKSGKLRKRKPKKSKDYFDHNTETAIIEYITIEDDKRKNYLFNTKINESIHKLAENIIHTFKFYYTDLSNVEELKHEVVTFLLNKLHLYDQTKGKAYSYLGTIAKRYLIQYNSKNYKDLKRKGDMTEVEDDKKSLNYLREGEADAETKDFIDAYVEHVEKKMDWYFIDEKEKDLVVVILDFFKKRETLDIFNKQIFYLYAKELTGQNSAFITKVVKKMKHIYVKQLNEYYINGGLKTEEGDIYI